MACVFLSLPTCFEYQGIYYIKTTSNQTTGIYWPYKIALYDNGIQVFIKSKSSVHLNLRPYNTLFGGLQPAGQAATQNATVLGHWRDTISRSS